MHRADGRGEKSPTVLPSPSDDARTHVRAGSALRVGSVSMDIPAPGCANEPRCFFYSVDERKRSQNMDMGPGSRLHGSPEQ